MLKTSPLDAQHRALGAKTGAFGGWDMPISYGGTVGEHLSTRSTVGIFDVSHLGKFRVAGPGAADLIDRCVTNRMADLVPGRARYSLLCADDGGIIDDLIVYGLAEDDYLVVPNASNRDSILEAIGSRAPGGVGVDLLDWTTIAVQGPASREIIERFYPATKGMGYMHVVQDGDVVIARSGYTGEVGYEVFTTADAGEVAWAALLAAVRDAGGEPCGLAARDTLRLEMGYPLHGNDIDISTTPAEAGLMWAVKPDGREFPGKENVGRKNKELIGLCMNDRVIPRRGCAVLSLDEEVGVITSGTFSPTLKRGIAMASVRPGSVNSEFDVDVRGKRGHASVVKPPFVQRSPK